MSESVSEMTNIPDVVSDGHLSVLEYLRNVKEIKEELCLVEDKRVLLRDMISHLSKYPPKEEGTKEDYDYLTSRLKIADKRLVEVFNKYLEKEEEADRFLKCISKNQIGKAVLYRRYIMGEPWKMVSLQMERSIRGLEALGKQAICELEELVKGASS